MFIISIRYNAYYLNTGLNSMVLTSDQRRNLRMIIFSRAIKTWSQISFNHPREYDLLEGDNDVIVTATHAMPPDRKVSDYHPFRKIIRKLIKRSTKRALIIDLHGKRGSNYIDIGTADGKSIGKDSLAAFTNAFSLADIDFVIDGSFKGSLNGTVISTFCALDGVNGIQLELPIELRRNTGKRVLMNAIDHGVKIFVMKLRQLEGPCHFMIC